MDGHKKTAYGCVAGKVDETSGEKYNNSIQKTVIYNERIHISRRGRPFRVGECWFLAAVRETAFKNVLVLGFFVINDVFRLSKEAYSKLFESEYRNNMPDDLFDSLRYNEANTKHPYTDIYVNKISKTTLYVNRADNVIIDIATDDASGQIPCLPCQQNKKIYGAAFKTWNVPIEKESGNSDGSSDDDDPPPDCYPQDFAPKKRMCMERKRNT